MAGDLLFKSGQGGINPEMVLLVEGSVKAQAEQAMKNLGELFKEAGTDFTKVVKTTCFLADMSHFAVFNGSV